MQTRIRCNDPIQPQLSQQGAEQRTFAESEVGITDVVMPHPAEGMDSSFGDEPSIQEDQGNEKHCAGQDHDHDVPVLFISKSSH